MTKKLVFAANWKLHKNPTQTREFLNSFKQKLSLEKNNSEKINSQKIEVIFFVPATNLEAASEVLKTILKTALESSISIGFGSQNCYSKATGAFTGEISAAIVKELGGQHVLIGHSERRALFGESDAFIADKGVFVQSLGLTPMLCVGETLSEREQGKTEFVVRTQLEAFLSKINLSLSFMIAYEPVWAIGTGKVASLSQVDEVHNFIRKTLNEDFKVPNADQLPILYGGSVKADNAGDLICLENVNGFLVGGASLEVDSFIKICLSF
jgi:triosephosphate isomerase